MVQQYSSLRLGLYGLGFVPEDFHANQYKVVLGNKTFIALIDTCKMVAIYPDSEYNAKNPYSQKDVQVDYEWDENSSSECILKNIEDFMNDICAKK